MKRPDGWRHGSTSLWSRPTGGAPVLQRGRRHGPTTVCLEQPHGLISADRMPRTVVAAVDNLEWRSMQGCLVGQVVAELGLGEPAQQAPRTITGEIAQVDTEDAVGHLRVAVRLRVEGRVEDEPDTREIEQLCPEGAGEYRIPVAHYGTRQFMEANDLVEEGLGDGRRAIGVAEGDEMSILREAIDHH